MTYYRKYVNGVIIKAVIVPLAVTAIAVCGFFAAISPIRQSLPDNSQYFQQQGIDAYEQAQI